MISFLQSHHTSSEKASDRGAESERVPSPMSVPDTETTSMVLRSEGLIKKYGKRTVVNGVSFDVKQGEIVGLLGPMEQERPPRFI